jgi:hypothetical protein
MLAFISALPAMAPAQQVVLITPTGEPPSSDGTSGSMTADGRYVLFTTSQGLAPDDTNNVSDAYVRDMQDGTVTRVSVSPNGSQIPEGAGATEFSSDGRFVLFSTNAALVPQAPTSCARPFGSLDTRPCYEIYMHDRQTHEITLVSQSTEGVAANSDISTTTMSDDGRFVLFASYATNLAPGTPSPARELVLFLRDRTAGTTTVVTFPNVGPMAASLRDAIISRDGNSILYSYWYTANRPPLDMCPSSRACTLTAAAVMDRSTGATQILDIPRPPEIPGTVNSIKVADISADGRFVLLFRDVISDDPTRSSHAEFVFHDRQESRTVTLAGCCQLEGVNLWGRLRADGRQVVYQQIVRTANGDGHPTLRMYDDRSRQTFELAGVSTFPFQDLGVSGTTMGAVHFSGDGSRVSFRAFGLVASHGFGQGSRLYSFKVDTDGDELPDRWENQFGLDPNASNDAAADADGDGITNLQEFLNGTHPRALFTRYLAEGVSNAVFSTRLALVNPGSVPAAVMLRYHDSSGGLAAPSTTTTVPPMSRITIDPAPMPGIDVADFSTVVESDALVVVDRTTNVHGIGHGSATETAIVQPSTTWYFAEGATGGPFSLFYQLQNPGDVNAQVSVTYLMPAPQPPLTKSYTVNARSRFTIPVDQEDPVLASADVSARISSDRPIIAERALYLDALNQPFGAVLGGAGVAAPATRWFLAEGATGSFFDLYVLIGNPGTTDANVSLTYLLPDGTHFTKTHLSAAQSRLTIQVDYEDPRLKDTPVSIVVDSGGVPVVVERTMWWPEGRWYEGHLSVASSVTSKKWVLAEGEISGLHAVQTYIEIANTSPTPGVATIRWLLDGDVGSAAATTVALPPNSRTNVPVTANMLSQRYPFYGSRFGAVIESDGVELIVERSVYRDVDGVTWAAGTNALATPIP